MFGTDFFFYFGQGFSLILFEIGFISWMNVGFCLLNRFQSDRFQAESYFMRYHMEPAEMTSNSWIFYNRLGITYSRSRAISNSGKYFPSLLSPTSGNRVLNILNIFTYLLLLLSFIFYWSIGQQRRSIFFMTPNYCYLFYIFSLWKSDKTSPEIWYSQWW